MAIRLRYLFALAVLFFLISAPFASADGMAYYRPKPVYVGPDSDLTTQEWAIMSENEQTALINYKDGREWLSIAIDVEGTEADEVVWIFPIPAKPDETNINIDTDIPEFFGDYLHSRAGQKVKGFAAGMRNVLILPLFAEAFLAVPNFFQATSSAAISSGSGGYAREVTVHMTREHLGVQAELITAESGSAIRGYLREKGFEVPQGSAALLESYVNKDYSFVVGWIKDYDTFYKASTSTEKRLIAMSVTFPTDHIFFPLKLTSAYGSATIPINVYVKGYVAPELFGELGQGRVSTQYFINDKAVNELQKKFTQIRINSPSSFFTQDLWIANSAPLDVGFSEFVISNEYLMFVLLLLLVSCISSLIVGNLVFIGKKVKQKTLLLFGLSNALTIVPFVLMVLFWDFEKSKLNGKWDEPKEKSERFVSRERKGAFVLVFIIVFALLTFVIEAAWGSEAKGHWEETKTVRYSSINEALCRSTVCETNATCQSPNTGCGYDGLCVGSVTMGGGQVISGHCEPGDSNYYY